MMGYSIPEAEMKNINPNWISAVTSTLALITIWIYRYWDSQAKTPGDANGHLGLYVILTLIVCVSLVSSAYLNLKASHSQNTVAAKYNEATSKPTDSVSGLTKSETMSVVPSLGLAIERVQMEALDNTPGRNYPRKLRIYFRENAGDEISLKRADWTPGGIGIQRGKPFVCQYELGEGGRFVLESPEKAVPPGKRLRLYVGLDSQVSEAEAKRLTEERLLGTLSIPAEVRGMKVTIKIKL
jgi:hypothetical protein